MAADDLTLAPNACILALINRDNTSVVLPPAAVTFGLPSTATTGTKNTQVTVSAVAGSGYKGSQVVNYNRLHLDSDVATPNAAVLTYSKGDAVNISDFLPEINASLRNVTILAADIVDGVIPTFTGTAGETHTATLTASEDSLRFIGSLTFTIKLDDIDLATVITTTNMDGLTYAAPAAS
jgi:hypothetical protein